MLFAEEDRRAFFLVGGVLDIGAPIIVSVVCIRAGASPLPHYLAKLWANGPPGEPKGTTDVAKVEMEVISIKVLGNVVISKKFLRTRKIMVMHSNERAECVHVPS